MEEKRYGILETTFVTGSGPTEELVKFNRKIAVFKSVELAAVEIGKIRSSEIDKGHKFTVVSLKEDGGYQTLGRVDRRTAVEAHLKGSRPKTGTDPQKKTSTSCAGISSVKTTHPLIKL